MFKSMAMFFLFPSFETRISSLGLSEGVAEDSEAGGRPNGRVRTACPGFVPGHSQSVPDILKNEH
jgi:hypothetical protein